MVLVTQIGSNGQAMNRAVQKIQTDTVCSESTGRSMATLKRTFLVIQKVSPAIICLLKSYPAFHSEHKVVHIVVSLLFFLSTS